MAGEGKQSEVESAEDERPQGAAGDDSAQGRDQEKDNDHAGSEGAEGADPAGKNDDPIEELADGRFRIIMGNSKYFGTTREEALKNAQAGAAEKDKAFQDARAKAVTHRGAAVEKADETAVPPEPKLNEIASALFKAHGLALEKANWGDAEWIAYQEKENLRDWQIRKEQERIDAAVAAAQRQFDEANLAWWNWKSLEDEITPSVQAIVAEADVDEEAFAEVYLKILKKPENRLANGMISGAKILSDVMREIIKQKPALKNDGALRARQKEEADKLAKQKEALKGNQGTTGNKHKVPNKAPTGLVNAHQLALKALVPGR